MLLKVPVKKFEFINLLTGNVIGYFSLDEELTAAIRDERLESCRRKFAVAHQIDLSMVYWQISYR